jgi:hypothetical protein
MRVDHRVADVERVEAEHRYVRALAGEIQGVEDVGLGAAGG